MNSLHAVYPGPIGSYHLLGQPIAVLRVTRRTHGTNRPATGPFVHYPPLHMNTFAPVPEMAFKSFTTRRQWHNTLMMVYLSPFLLLVGVLLLAMKGYHWGLVAAGVLVLAGSLIALARDLGDRCHYSFRNETLILETKGHREEIPLAEVVDASLIDRMAAREYIRSRSGQVSDGRKAQDIRKEFIRFCSVDIGMRSITLGLGRSVIDRLPMSKQDLVLLRLRGGKAYLLSPKYNQDLVDVVSRAISSRSSF